MRYFADRRFGRKGDVGVTEENVQPSGTEHHELPPAHPRTAEERRAVAKSLERMKGSAKIHGDILAPVFDEDGDWNEERNLGPEQTS